VIDGATSGAAVVPLPDQQQAGNGTPLALLGEQQSLLPENHPGETTDMMRCSDGKWLMFNLTSTEDEPLPLPPSYRRWTVPSSVQLGILRAQLRYLVRCWGFPEDCTDRIPMIVYELAATAIDHARTTCDITVRRTRSVVRVLVADDSPLPPRVLPHDVNAARGRGLQMVKRRPIVGAGPLHRPGRGQRRSAARRHL
jgi:hypothetical protein